MSAVNYTDAMRQIEAMQFDFDRPMVFDGRIQRWRVRGEDTERRGWTRLKEWVSGTGDTYLVGDFGVWHGNDDGRCRIEVRKEAGIQLTSAELSAIRAAQKESSRRLAEERKAESRTAARWAAAVWARCIAAPPDHEYLLRKRIQPHGSRLLASLDDLVIDGVDEQNWWRLTHSVGALVVPMHDEHGNVCGLQLIYDKGHARRKKTERDKEFWPAGMAMAGTFGLIGALQRSGTMMIAEGFATAASLHEATGISCAYAFSANNMVKAGRALRKTCPRAKLLFCADDDYITDGNPGCTAAAHASAEIEHSAWIAPDFTSDKGGDLREGKKLSDFNDLAILTGIPLVLATQINGKLDALGWRGAGASVAARNGGGGGEPPAGGDRRPAARSLMSIDELVERFVPIDDGTGKYVFDIWANRLAHRDQMIALLPAGQRADDIKRHPVWSSRGAYYLDQVGFDPSGSDASVKLNTWRGWPLQPRAGSCERIIETIEYLCGDEDNSREICQWLLRWMAYPLQHPGAKMSSAVILHGPQGTGKSAVFQTLARIYGDYATVLNQRGLEDKFNADWADSKLFILAEEVVARAEMWHIKNELKELVTGEWIRVNPKNIAAYRQKNHLNVAYLSNETQPLPLENDDRRHCVIYTPPMLSEQYYDELFQEIDAGGTEAFYAYLMTLDLGDFHPKKRPPMTQSKRALINLSLPSEARFMNEYAMGDTRWPVLPSLAADFYAAYLRWCRDNGEPRPRPSNQFFGSLIRAPGWQKKKQRVQLGAGGIDDSTGKPVVFPPIDAMERAGTAQPPAKSPVAWVTDCVVRFRETGRDGEQWVA